MFPSYWRISAGKKKLRPPLYLRSDIIILPHSINGILQIKLAIMCMQEGKRLILKFQEHWGSFIIIRPGSEIKKIDVILCFAPMNFSRPLRLNKEFTNR